MTTGIEYTPDTSVGNVLGYQWMRGDEDIPAAIDAQYQLTTADIGQVIRVRVSADGIEADGVVMSPATGMETRDKSGVIGISLPVRFIVFPNPLRAARLIS